MNQIDRFGMLCEKEPGHLLTEEDLTSMKTVWELFTHMKRWEYVRDEVKSLLSASDSLNFPDSAVPRKRNP